MRGVSQLALSAKRQKNRKRHTALPGELLESIKTADLTPKNSPDTQPQNPISPSDLTTDIHARLTPNRVRTPSPEFAEVEPFALAVAKYPTPTAINNNKRPINATAVDCRPSLGVSPRPIGCSRRHSLQANLPEGESAAKPKKLCFIRDESDSEGSDWESSMTAEHDIENLVVPVRNLRISEENLEDDEDGGGRRRSSRAAKDKIKSMKEPSLHTKMRRPINVPPLTPTQDRRRSSARLKKTQEYE